jgi:Tfp pilus assembly protein PilV
MWKKLVRSFTLLEILFVVIAVSIWLMSVLTAVDYALRNVQSVKQRVIAINLAREWLEWIYQIRDTNRLIWPSKKDECRLDMNPLIDEPSDWCSDDTWMWSGNYVLQKTISDNQQSFYISWWSSLSQLDLSDWIQTGDNKFALCISWNLREACPDHNWSVTYFRQIHGEWLFSKDSNTTGWDYLNCVNWSDINLCWWIEAKEYRFCSKVAYVGQWKWEVELCWLITNFAK